MYDREDLTGRVKLSANTHDLDPYYIVEFLESIEFRNGRQDTIRHVKW